MGHRLTYDKLMDLDAGGKIFVFSHHHFFVNIHSTGGPVMFQFIHM